MRVLVEEGANKDAANKWGWMHLAAFDGHEAVESVQVEAGANIDAAKQAGRTPLHEAARKGVEVVVRVQTVEVCTNKDAAGKDWNTPLALARQEGSSHVSTLLKAAGAK